MAIGLADFLAATARRDPDGVSIVVGDRRYTWAQLDEDVTAWGAGLLARGVRDGERVGLLLSNTYEFVVAYFAALRSGLVAVPINPAYTGAEVAVLLADSQARLLLVQPATRTVGEEAALATGGCEVVSVMGSQWAQIGRAGSESITRRAPSPRPSGNAAGGLGVLLFTAGTSGRPKGAMLTQAALRANVEMLLALKEPPAVTPDDVMLVVLPLFHVYGLNAVLGLAVAAGARCVLVDRFDPVETLQVIAEEQVTAVAGAPAMYRAWCAAPGLADALASVRLLTSGGAPLPESTFDQFELLTGKRIHEGYGMTETSPVVTTTLVSGAPKQSSVGRPLPGLEVRLVDSSGRDVVDGDPGEVWVRGPSVFAGYWPDGAGGADRDGWFRSGDVAYADEDGDLHLVDRRREVILVNGFNVYPREVERAIDSLDGVAETAVVGVPDDDTGEAVVAFVVPRAGRTISADRVAEHCAVRLARFKWPTIIRIVDALPHSVTGKVAKGRLREVHSDWVGDDAATDPAATDPAATEPPATDPTATAHSATAHSPDEPA